MQTICLFPFAERYELSVSLSIQIGVIAPFVQWQNIVCTLCSTVAILNYEIDAIQYILKNLHWHCEWVFVSILLLCINGSYCIGIRSFYSYFLL